MSRRPHNATTFAVQHRVAACDRCGDEVLTERYEIHDGWIMRHCAGCKRAMAHERSGYRSPRGWVLFAALVALLTGCGEDRVIRFEAEVALSQAPELLWSCASASERWAAASGILFDCSSVDLEWETAEELGQECRDGGCYQRGGQAREGVIAVHEQLSATLDEIMLHEIGHQITRSSDHPGDGSAMYAFVTPNAQINAADLEWLCASAECTRFQTEE